MNWVMTTEERQKLLKQTYKFEEICRYCQDDLATVWFQGLRMCNTCRCEAVEDQQYRWGEPKVMQ